MSIKHLLQVLTRERYPESENPHLDNRFSNLGMSRRNEEKDKTKYGYSDAGYALENFFRFCFSNPDC